MHDDSQSTGVARKTIDMQGEVAGSASEATLIARHTTNALRRRALLAAGTTLVKRDPKDIAGAIALGFVLRGRGLGAALRFTPGHA